MSAGEVVLITGAGSGIGRETAFTFAEEGALLVLCDIDAEGLERTADLSRDLGAARVDTHVVDVSKREAMRAFADAVHAAHPAVDVLVNNAGVAIGGPFMATDLDAWDWILGVNLRGVVHGCHFFLPRMVERGRGHVVIVSSAAGFTPSKSMPAYVTTKFAVLGLAESLRAELAAKGIGVSAICPGLINTPITRNTRLVGSRSDETVRRKIVRLYERRNYGPEKVAAAVRDAVRRNRAVVPVAPEAWALYYLRRLVPGLLRRFDRTFDPL